MYKFAAISTSLMFSAGIAASASADAVEFAAAGSDASVTATVDAFRAAIGGINANVPGSFLSGRREINWDAVPDAFSAPNAFPGNFLNAGVAPRARGAEFSTPGSSLMCSANAVNPAGAPINFGNIDPSYSTTFRQFSPQRLFTAIDSNTVEVKFFIPGQSSTRATVKAFGAIFTDVDIQGPTTLQYFEQSGALLHTAVVPPTTNGQGGFSFMGVAFTGSEKIWRVVIRTGTHALAAGVLDNPAGGIDVAAMDDFIYSEPVTVTDPLVIASGGTDQQVTDSVNAYRAALGTLNPNNPGSVGSGRREINWDAVPDASSSPSDLPLDFFNGANPGRARGAVFSTPGSSVQVSADDDNPTATLPLFANINPSYADLFRTFSPQRLFQPIGSNQVSVNFFVPGSATAASVSGFGAVFTDVDTPTGAKIEYFDQRGNLLASLFAPVGGAAQQSLSFLGAMFSADYKCASVRISSGSAALGSDVNESASTDLVVMDDFVYGEPVELPPLCRADYNQDGFVNSADFFDFLVGFFQTNADFNQDGVTNSQDFYDFLIQFFVGC
ncbi:MAG: hypothetical protein AB7G11_17310 [Phycisphaerales bacterium]